MEDKPLDNPEAWQMRTVSGVPLKIGPTQKMRNAKNKMLMETGMALPPDRTPRFMIYLLVAVETALLLGAIGRMVLTWHIADVQDLIIAESFMKLFSNDFKEEEQRVNQIFHVLLSIVCYQVILPQLVILRSLTTEMSDNRRSSYSTIIWQFLIACVVIFMAVGNHTVSILMTAHGDKNCTEKKTCSHRAWSYYVLLFLLFFFAILCVRVLFYCRSRYITRIKCIGPVIEFAVSSRVTEFIEFCLLIVVLGTNLSGLMILSTIEKNGKPLTVGLQVAEVSLDKNQLINILSQGVMYK